MLADDRQMREEMGRKGQKAAWEKYDRKIIADQLMGTFAEVVSSFNKG